MTNEMPKEIWLITNGDIEEGEEYHTVWSADPDCERIHEGYKKQAHYIRADLAQNIPATSSAADSSGINASLSSQAEPADALERGEECRRCNGKGEWYGNDGQAGPYKCSPCPAPVPTVDERGWIIMGRKNPPVTPEQAAEVLSEIGTSLLIGCEKDTFMAVPYKHIATIRALLKHAAGV